MPPQKIDARLASKKSCILIAASTLVLLIPAIFNGHPFLFYDSEHYFLIGKSITHHLVSLFDEAKNAAVAMPAGPQVESEGQLAAIAGGRSPFYSILVYILSTASVWLIPLLQAASTGWLITRFLDFAWAERRSFATLAATFFLTAVTALGFHVSFLMPDIYAAIFLLAATIFAFDAAAKFQEKLVLTAAMTASMAMHGTVMALGVASLGVIALLLSGVFGKAPTSWRTSLPGLFLALVLVAGVSALYSVSAKIVSGHSPQSPPYLMARVIADGPGKLLLSDMCDHAIRPYTACVFADELYVTQNDVLWGAGGQKANFATLSSGEKASLKSEELRFVVAAVRAYPLKQLAASLTNFGYQFWLVGTREVRNDAEFLAADKAWANTELLKLVPNMGRCGTDEASCYGSRSPREIWSAVSTAVGVLGNLLFLAALIALSRHSRNVPLPFLLSGYYLGAMLVLNAAICGVLSGPHDRYQARIAWLAWLYVIASTKYLLRGKSGRSNAPA